MLFHQNFRMRQDGPLKAACRLCFIFFDTLFICLLISIYLSFYLSLYLSLFFFIFVRRTFESRLQVVLDLLGEHRCHQGGATTEE